MGIAAHPPHGSRRAAFPHRALASGMTCLVSGWPLALGTETLPDRGRVGDWDTPVPGLRQGRVPLHGTSLGQAPSLHPLRRRRLTLPCSRTSSVLRTCPTSRLRSSAASAPRLPAADLCAEMDARSNTRSPRFRHAPFVRDGVFDLVRVGFASHTGWPMLSSTHPTVSTSGDFVYFVAR